MRMNNSSYQGGERQDESAHASTKHPLTLSGLQVPIFVVDSACHILEWNQALTELTGYALEDVQGSSIESLCISSNKHCSCFKDIVRNTRDQPGTCKMVLAAKDGSAKHFSGRTLLHSQGRDDSIAFVFLLEETLSSSSADLTPEQTSKSNSLDVNRVLEVGDPNSSCRLDRSACCLNVEDIPSPVFCFSNHDSTITRWNSLMEDLTGYTADESIGKKHISLLRNTTRQCGCAGANMFSSIMTSSGKELIVSFETKALGSWETIVAVRSTKIFCPLLSLESLGELVNTLNTPFFGIDSAGKVNEWNNQMVEITGYARAEALNAPFVENFVPLLYMDAVSGQLEKLLGGVISSASFDIIVNTKNVNQRRYLHLNVSSRHAENNIAGVVVLAQDITETSKHEKAAASMARELRQFIDSANAPFFGVDCDGKVNEWNEKTAEITGYSKEEAFGCHLVQTFIVPDMRNLVQHVIDRALQGQGSSNFEFDIQTKSHEIRHLLVNANTRRDADNIIVGVVVVAQDVTEAVKRDRAVAGMALELRQLIDNANAPIFGVDTEGNINEWNKLTQEITGFSKDETFDEPLVERFITSSMHQQVREVLEAALQGHETSNFEMEFISKSGEPKFLLVNPTTRRDPESNIVGVVVVAQDVTERKKHAAELRKLQCLQAKQEAKVETERNMTAYFAHELRNPLGAIDSALSAMPEGLPDSARSLIDGMQLCCSFMSSIMNNLLDVRKMEEGKMTLNKVPLSLGGLVHRVHMMLLPAVRPGVDFEYAAFTEGRDWVLGDQHRIQQVLTNVVTNAIKYTLAGLVRLSVSWDKGSVRIECTDTGPGIPKLEQEKLFQRFVQRGGAPGTGLGLAIAKHLVDLMGGNIRFISDPSVQPGTTCRVQLPLELCDAPENSFLPEKATATLVLPERLCFLIIDDVEMNRKMLGRRIMKSIAPNCNIEEATTGEEALKTCGHRTFDVIIVDQYMEEAGGVMVGTDVVYAMRRMRIDSIIIGCSGNDLNREFIEAGADRVWQKPLPPNETIISHLRALLKDLKRRRRKTS